MGALNYITDVPRFLAEALSDNADNLAFIGALASGRLQALALNAGTLHLPLIRVAVLVLIWNVIFSIGVFIFPKMVTRFLKWVAVWIPEWLKGWFRIAFGDARAWFRGMLKKAREWLQRFRVFRWVSSKLQAPAGKPGKLERMRELERMLMEKPTWSWFFIIPFICFIPSGVWAAIAALTLWRRPVILKMAIFVWSGVFVYFVSMLVVDRAQAYLGLFFWPSAAAILLGIFIWSRLGQKIKANFSQARLRARSAKEVPAAEVVPVEDRA